MRTQTIALFLLSVIILTGCSQSDSSTSSTSPMSIGAEGKLDTGVGTVDVAKNQQTQNDISSAAAAGDKVGYKNILESGRVMEVKDGTQAKIIGYGDGLMGASVYHVRIEGGEFDGADGWVPMEFLKKQ